ncbi:MAG: hypothetical protein ABW044_04775, partial [Cellvibrio sp.]
MNSKVIKLQPALNLFCILLIGIVLLAPNRLSDFGWHMFVALPVEILILGLGSLLPGRIGKIFRIFAAIILAIGIILKIADIAVFQ